ncbi:hypothetical protein [Paenibacillus sp. B2(2019)]|uniref:hypothetical protein n=1 Tax=Paenibacillus sp. B2(2019) TaxID=2607754 RepID=UPI0011F18326|nr:hypothetical protein [Paenibacillus sp. B2(2019)]KAA1180719.1 hypothetical protein PAENI_26075 [Paenibacillus sp. B2(2019)]
MNDEFPIISEDKPVPIIRSEVDNFSQGLTLYLNHLGLPSANVLVNPLERFKVINNLPDIVLQLNPNLRRDSMYISKFIAACSAGLFDAALNMLWNETVINLRGKVKRFDMDYFLDSVITDSRRRALFKNEDDLNKLEEWELVKGCKDTGIISDIGYKHLDYIRDMRNHASAAHPNHNDVTGLQLVSWLETCINEVLAKEPEGPVVQIKQLLHNLRSKVLTKGDVLPITSSIQQLPESLINSTLRAVFGMYTTVDLGASVRNNLNLIAPSLWKSSNKQAKFDIGLKYAIFSANAELDRKQFAHDFLILVDGLAFMPSDIRASHIDQALDSLSSAHYGWDNFYHEGSPARLLASYIPDTGEIPESVMSKYIKVLTICRIGNPYGVSGYAQQYYDEMISKFSDAHFNQFVLLLWDDDVQSRLGSRSCSSEYARLANSFSEKTVNIKLRAILKKIHNPEGTNLQGAPLANAHRVTNFFNEVDAIVI